MKKKLGFSLIEILLVLVIIGILTVAITPSFKGYMLRGNRSDAIKSLLHIQMNEEKWRVNNTSYTTTITNISPTGSGASIDGHYTLAIGSASASAYTLTAAPTGSQADDTDCALFTLTYANGTTTLTSSPSTTCWQQ